MKNEFYVTRAAKVNPFRATSRLELLSGTLPQYQISVQSNVFLTLLSTVNSVSTI